MVERQRKAGQGQGLCPRGAGGHGEWVAGLLLFELGLRLGLQLRGLSLIHISEPTRPKR